MHAAELRAYKKAIWWVAGIGFVFALFEAIALNWQAWGYNAAHTLNVHIVGTEIETYLFSVATALAIAFATFVVADREAAGKSILKHIVGRFKRPARK